MRRRDRDEEGWDWLTFWGAMGLAILVMVLLFLVGAWFVNLLEETLEEGSQAAALPQVAYDRFGWSEAQFAHISEQLWA